MFSCVLRCYGSSTVLIPKTFAHFTEGADRERLLEAISVNRYNPFTGVYNQLRQSLEPEGLPESEAWGRLWFLARVNMVLNVHRKHLLLAGKTTFHQLRILAGPIIFCIRSAPPRGMNARTVQG